MLLLILWREGIITCQRLQTVSGDTATVHWIVCTLPTTLTCTSRPRQTTWPYMCVAKGLWVERCTFSRWTGLPPPVPDPVASSPHGGQWHSFEKESQTVTPLLRARPRLLPVPPGPSPACSASSSSPVFTTPSLLIPHFAPASQAASLFSWDTSTQVFSCFIPGVPQGFAQFPFFSEACLTTSVSRNTASTSSSDPAIASPSLAPPW